MSIIVATIAGTPATVLSVFTAAGLWVPATDTAPAQLAAPVTVSGVPGAQMGPGGIVYITAPEYDAEGELTNTPEVDPRRTYLIRVDNRGNPHHPNATLDAVIDAALPLDADLFARLRTLASGQPYGDPEGDPEGLIQPPQGPTQVSLPALIFRLWVTKGTASDDPVLGPVRTLMGVSLVVGDA